MVADQTAPIITLIGSGSVTVALGGTYTDSGATCTDNLDATCTVSVTGSVNTAQTGSYVLTYSATDAAGNVATGVTRTVVVADQTVVVIPKTGPGGGGGGGGGSSTIGRLLFTYSNISNDNTITPTSIKKTIRTLITSKIVKELNTKNGKTGITR